MSWWPMLYASSKSPDLKRTSVLGLALLIVAGCDAKPEGRPTLSSASAAPSSAQAAAPAKTPNPCADLAAPSGTILFVSERDGNLELYAMPAAGGAERRLTSNDVADYPSPSPAGVGFLPIVQAKEGPDGARREHIVLLDKASLQGGAPTFRALDQESSFLRHPSVSADGKIMIVEADFKGFRDLYELDVATGKTKRLTDHPLGSFEPDLSPDGQTIVFGSSRDGNAEVYTLTRKTGWIQRLTWSPEDDTSPLFSPDGSRIAFVRSRRGTAEVFLMAPDGSHPTPLRTGADLAAGRTERDLTWSPDGQRVAFAEQVGGQAHIRVVDVATGAVVARSEGDPIDEQPAFSPDGKHLVFSSNRDGDTELYRMASDGSCPVRLTHHKGADWLARWLPPPG